MIRDPHFPKHPKQAIINGFEQAEQKFLEICQDDDGIIDKSGS